MKAVMVMFDSLNRNLLTPYGCDWTKTPNFSRLAEKSVCFDASYAGSLPCMPARRELHTGRCNFLHRSWGPLEPFDDSMPQILKNHGVYTHLVSDHMHYWEDGGATYHGRYNSWEVSRGQEGDRVKAKLPLGEAPKSAFVKSEPPVVFSDGAKYYDEVNRGFITGEEKMPQAVTFANGLDFLRENYEQDNWFLQIETFDPHEPFFSPEVYKSLYPHEYNGDRADWPPYYPVCENTETVQHVRYTYAALLSMCDACLGKVLDFMDAHDMWKDTMLIVNTDHGFLLGEHDWWGKSVMPVYDEIARTPLFVWDPREGVSGVIRKSLVQTIDIASTILDFFGQEIPPDMEGRSLRQVIRDDTPIREYAVFGYHGGHVNITDGCHTYMRSPVESANAPLFEYTLMPTHMRERFSAKEFQSVELSDPFTFTKGCKVLKIHSAAGYFNPYQFGDKLFNAASDPAQSKEIEDTETELRFIAAIAEYMRKVDAPPEQFERLGIPRNERMTAKMLMEQKDARKLALTPEILTDYTWEEGAKYQFRALLSYSQDKREEMQAGFEAFVKEISEDRFVTKDILLAFLMKVMPKEMAEMLRYGFVMLGRSS